MADDSVVYGGVDDQNSEDSATNMAVLQRRCEELMIEKAAIEEEIKKVTAKVDGLRSDRMKHNMIWAVTESYRADTAGYRADTAGYRADTAGYRAAAARYREAAAGYRAAAAGYRVAAAGYKADTTESRRKILQEVTILKKIIPEKDKELEASAVEMEIENKVGVKDLERKHSKGKGLKLQWPMVAGAVVAAAAIIYGKRR